MCDGLSRTLAVRCDVAATAYAVRKPTAKILATPLLSLRALFAVNRFLCCNRPIKLSCSISDTGDCHGYCQFPAFLWQPHQKQTDTTSGWFGARSPSAAKSRGAGERRWIEQTVYKTEPEGSNAAAAAALWVSRREITARPTEIWTERRVRTPCASSAAGPGGRDSQTGGRMACYRRESASNTSCLAEEPSGKYRVLVTDADGWDILLIMFDRINGPRREYLQFTRKKLVAEKTNKTLSKIAIDRWLTLWRPLLPYGYSCARPG